jgi:hypothetical protein
LDHLKSEHPKKWNPEDVVWPMEKLATVISLSVDFEAATIDMVIIEELLNPKP